MKVTLSTAPCTRAVICTTWNASTEPGTLTAYCCFDVVSVITSTGYSILPPPAPRPPRPPLPLAASELPFEHAAQVARRHTISTRFTPVVVI